MFHRIRSWLLGKRVGDDYVDISIGRVRLYELNGGIVNRCAAAATVANDVLNNNLYFMLMEQELWTRSPREWQMLSVSDSEKLRAVVRRVLLRHGVISEPKPSVTAESSQKATGGFSQEEEDIFKKQFEEMQQRIKGGMNG